MSGVSFITSHVACASTNKTKIVWMETELFSLPGADTPPVYVGGSTLCCFHSLISTQTFRMALTASVDSCWKIKSAPSMSQLILAEFGGRCRKAMLGLFVVLWIIAVRSHPAETRIEACLCVFLSQRAHKLKGHWGIAPRKKEFPSPTVPQILLKHIINTMIMNKLRLSSKDFSRSYIP